MKALLLYCLIGFIGYSRAQSVCTTPSGEYGRCIQLDQCESLKNRNSYSLIRQSKCGSSDYFTYVCCPSESNHGSSYQNPSESNFASSHQRPSQTNFGSSNQRPSESNFGSSYQNPSESNFGSSHQRPSQTNFGSSNQRPSESNFGSSYQNPSQSNFGSSHQRPSQANFGSSNQRPSESNFGSSYQNPSQSNFDSSYQRPTQSNSGSSYQRPSKTNYGSPSQTQENRRSQHSGRLTAGDLPPAGRCGTQAKDRIVGGEEASISDFPWMTLIHYARHGRSGGYFCGGALIHERYVITAAHCIRGPSLVKAGYAPDSVRLGENDLRTTVDCEEGECADPALDIEVAETIVHDDYDPESPSQHNDIALLRLARPAPYTDFIRPVCLPIAQHLRNKNFDYVHLVVAGFGRTENASRSDVKLKLEINGFNLEECESIYRNIGLSLNRNQMCAGGEDGKDSCSGDSGGPLTGEDNTNPINPYAYLAGVVSLGPSKCGTPGFPGVYTRVNQYIDWILSHMRK